MRAELQPQERRSRHAAHNLVNAAAHGPCAQEILVSPQLLDQYQIPYVRAVQRPREFVSARAGQEWGGDGADCQSFQFQGCAAHACDW